MNALKRLWRGEIGLWKVFWGAGVVGTPLVVAGAWYFTPCVAGFWRLVVVIVLVAAYGFLISVSIWRAAAKKSAAFRIGTYAVVSLAWVAAITLAAWAGWVFRPDFSATSRNIESRIEYDPGWPFIGFWKVNCSDDFGVAIEKADANHYYVRFCGPGGCFGKGPFTRTSLVDDESYRVVDNDTIGMKMSGETLQSLPATERAAIEQRIQGGFLMYRRCTGR